MNITKQIITVKPNYENLKGEKKVNSAYCYACLHFYCDTIAALEWNQEGLHCLTISSEFECNTCTNSHLICFY